MVLSNNSKSKTNKNKVVNTNTQDKNLIYNPQNSFPTFKDISDFKEVSLDSMHKRLNDFLRKFNNLKTVNLQTEKNKNLKLKV